MVPVPWLTSSKPAQMSWSPSMQPLSPTHTHMDTHTLKYLPLQTLSWPHNQNKALRWHLLSQEHSLALWVGICGISSLLQYIFLICLPPSCPWSWQGSHGIRGPLTPSMVRFLNDLTVEMSLTLAILCCPKVRVCFQEGQQGQEAPAKTQSVRFQLTDLSDRK